VTKAAPVVAEQPKPKALKFTFKEQREFEAIEGEVAALEAKVAELKAAIEAAATDYGRLQGLYAEQVEAEAELGRKLDRWAELTELAEAIEAQKAERQGGRS
jgi:ATP-binding cassette subfamily F protein uup